MSESQEDNVESEANQDDSKAERAKLLAQLVLKAERQKLRAESNAERAKWEYYITASSVILIMAVIVGSSMVLVKLFGLGINIGSQGDLDSRIDTVVEDRMSVLAAEVKSLRDHVHQLVKLPEDLKIANEMYELGVSIERASERLQSLEDAIMQDPAKAMQFPMLRKEMESMEKNYRSDLLAVRQELGRVYDLCKWFLGLMFTMALGGIGLAVTNLIGKGRATEGKTDE